MYAERSISGSVGFGLFNSLGDWFAAFVSLELLELSGGTEFVVGVSIIGGKFDMGCDMAKLSWKSLAFVVT